MALRPAYVDLLIGGLWTDITPTVYIGDGITITRGRSGQGSTVDPGRCSMTLNNQSGRYSPRNPVGAYYGQIGRNTGIRVSVAAGTPWLGVNDPTGPRLRVSTPDASVVDILGDIDIRADIQPTDLTSGGIMPIAAKWGASGQRSWYLVLVGDLLQLVWSADGSTLRFVNSALIPGTAVTRICVRATLDVDNGASGNTVTFYTAPSMAGPWTMLGTPLVSAVATSLFNSSTAMEIGDRSSSGGATSPGRIYSVEVRNGIGGTLVANPLFTAQAAGNTSFTDSAGRAWTANTSAAITNRHVRFVGEVSEWPPVMDASVTDIRVPIEAGGILRRLGKGSAALSSTLRRRLPALGPVAYWPMEDGSDSTQAASPIAGCPPLQLAGAQFAAHDGPPGSDQLPTLTLPATFSATVPAPTGTPASWQIEYLVQMDTVPVGLTAILQFRTTMSRWPVINVQLSSTQVLFTGITTDGTTSTTLMSFSIGAFNGPFARNQLIATQSGSDVVLTWMWEPVGGTTGSGSVTITGATVGHVSVINTALGITSTIGHLSVFEPAQPNAFDNADTGFSGEMASTRISRLCAEMGVPMTFATGSSVGGVMGPQLPGKFLDLLRECESADMGILYEQREVLGLAYQARSTLYNQTPTQLDFAAKEISPPLRPTDDDQRTLNDITVSRVNGSSARAVQTTGPLSTAAPPAGVGLYDTAPPALNVVSDSLLPDLAGWLLHLGTWDESRYPAVRVSLDAAPGAVDRVAELDIGDRLQIVHPPAWLATTPIDLMVQGYTETISGAWDIMFTGDPAGPYTVGVLEDLVLGRLDTDGSQLSAGVSSTVAVLSVATPSGPLWVIDPAETPFDLVVSGERVTVTTVGTQLAANPFFLVDASGWPGMNASAARSTAQVPPVSGAVASLLITPNGSSASGGTNGPLTGVGTVTPGATYVASCWAYSPGGWSDLRACVDWYDASGVLLSSGLGSATVVAAGTWTMLQQVLTAPASASQAVPRARHGGTPAAGNTWYASAIRLVPTSSNATSPQQMTATRSVNGVVKSQSSGAAVSLWQPLYLGL